MLQTTTIVYPIAAFLLTLLVILFHKLFIWAGIRNNQEYVPVMLNSRDDMIDTALRIICVIVLGFFAFSFDFRFSVAPPLLVAFTEFSRPRNKARNMPVRTVAMITGCALIGAAFRYLLNISLGLPLTVAAVTATFFTLLVIWYTKIFMPPAGARISTAMSRNMCRM